MSRPAPPVLTIRHDGSQRTFAPGHDVIIGRDLRTDIRITDPRISRAHLILRFDQGRWQAIDNGSVNGTYVNGYRMPVIDIHDGQSINVGNAGGPRLTFELGQQPERAGRPPGMGSPHSTESSTIAWQTPPEPVQSRSRPARQSDSLSQSASRPAPPPATHRYPGHPAPHSHGTPTPPRTPPYPTGLQRSVPPPDSPPPDEITPVSDRIAALGATARLAATRRDHPRQRRVR